MHHAKVANRFNLRFETFHSNRLNTGLVWYSNGRFVLVCQMAQYPNGGLKSALKKPVYGPKCLVFKWSAKSRDNHLNTGHWYSGVQYSDGYCNFYIETRKVFAFSFSVTVSFCARSVKHWGSEARTF